LKTEISKTKTRITAQREDAGIHGGLGSKNKEMTKRKQRSEVSREEKWVEGFAATGEGS